MENKNERDLKIELLKYIFTASRQHYNFKIVDSENRIDPATVSRWNVDKNTEKFKDLRNTHYLILQMPSYIWRKYPEVEKLIWTLN